MIKSFREMVVEGEKWVIYDITDPKNLVKGLDKPFGSEKEAVRQKPREGEDWKASTLSDYQKVLKAL